MSKLMKVSFRLLDLMVILAMTLGSPMSAAYALTDQPENAATGQIGGMAKIMPATPAPELEAFPLDSLALEEAPQLIEWNAPLRDGAGNADVIYNVGCMQESAGFNLNCTANDISIAQATNIAILDDGCAYPGDTVTFQADFEVKLTAQARYDVGLWFATDGDPNNDAAKTGTCSAATPAYAPDPPWLDLDQAVAGQADDSCGDIDDAHNPLYPSVTLTVMCVDDDANGKLDLPNCTSWRQPGDNSLCTSPVQAVPGAPSKCKCDTGFNVDIPVPGQIIVDKVTDPSGQSTSFDFTLSGTPTGGSPITPVTFNLADADDPFESSFLYAGTYSVAEAANSSYSTTAECTSSHGETETAGSIDLEPGEIVTCTFTNKLLTGTLIVNKTLVNDNSGTKTCADFSYNVDGGTAVPFETDCSNSQTVLAGAHTVVEVGVPIDGYTTTYNNCTNVNVPAGGTATCTITNDDVAVPGMTVEKSSTTTSLSAPGTVTYDYVVTNTGNTALTGITLSDNNDNDDMSCPATTLAKGDSMTCHATHTFTQAELDAGGTLDNTVTADSNETEPVTDDLSIPISQSAAIIVVKASTTVQIVEAGQVVPYTFTVDNEGNTTLTGITVSDPNCDAAPVYSSGDANGDGKLQVDETWVYTCDHTVTQAEIDSNGGGDGDLDNTVTADSNESAPDTDDHTIPVDYNPAMTVEKSSATTSLSAPTTVTYDYLVTNTGNVTLSGINLSDDNDNDDILCEGDTLAVGESMTCTATHTFTQAELDTLASLDNIVTADSNETEPVTDDLSIPITQSAAIIVVKASTTVEIVEAGQVVPYTFTVDNDGNTTLTGITVSDPKCDEAPAYVSGDANNDGKLQVDETWIYTCNHTVTQAEIDTNGGGDGDLDNTVTADSNESAPDTDDHAIPVDYSPAMTVDKSSATTSLSAPATVTYDYLVTNTGNVTLTGIALSDNNDNNDMVCEGDTLAPAATMTCTATHTFTQAELDAGGTLDNTVTADSNETEPVTDSLSIPISKNASMTVEKSSATTSLSAPATVTYDYLVTNTGNVTLTGIVLSDNNDNDDMSCPAAALAVGESMTCHATHTFTQAELDAGGTLDNTVTADSAETEPVTDSLSIPITKNAAMTVEKSSATTSLSSPGTVTYDYVVTNTGNVTLTGISLSDNNDNDDLSCPATTLAVGANMTCHATHTFTQAELDAGGTLDNTVTASSNGTEPVTDSLSIPIEQTASMTVEKSSTTTILSAPATVTYDYVVTNTGNVTLTGIALSDDNDNDDMSCPATTLAVGATMTCHATHTFTQAELDAGGTLDNTVTASSNEAPDATDALSIPISQSAAIIVVKASTTAEIVEAGQVVPYTFTVTNEGNVTLTGITVTDPMCDSAPVYDSGDTNGDNKLQTTETWVYTCDHTVTQAEVDAGGDLINTVTADSNESEEDTDTLEIPVIQSPAISLVKTGTFDAGADGYANVGELISYEFLVTNEGNVTLTGITVTDPKVSPITCPATTLAVGANMTCTGTYAVTQADIDAGFVYNLATADSNESGPDDGDNNEPLPQNPLISLVKTGTFDAGANNYADLGELISYEFLVTNEGNVTLTGITVTDPKVSPISCPADTLAVGGSMTCTGSYAVTQADIDAGFVYNLATADSNESGPDDGDNNEPLPQNPAISLVKSGTFNAGADGYANVGELISYEFLVTNEGNVTLTGITVTDPKVANISCPLDTLAVGESMTCTGTYAVTQADIDAGFVYNLATADSDESEPDDGDNNEPLPQNPAIDIVKTGTFDAGADGYADPGEVISYEFLVTNEGNITLTGITVTDPLFGLSAIVCPADTLAVGASMTCTATYAVTQADIDAGSVYNLATADSNESEEDTDGETVTLPQNPAIDVQKLSTTTLVDHAGQVVYYSFFVSNVGNVTLTGITVSDPKCDATPAYLEGDDDNDGALQLAEIWTYTCTHIVTQAEIDAATGTDPQLHNMVTADSNESDEDTDEKDIPIKYNPLISIAKTGTFDAGADGYANVDELISYDFLVTNEGNATLTGITVTDPKVANISCPKDTLAVGENMTCTGTYAVTQDDIDAGSVYNMVTVESNESGPDDDDETITLPQNPVISIAKTGTFDAGADGYANVGELISYSFLVTNEGNVTLTGITVTDPKVSNISCPADTLAVGANMTCTGTYTVTQADVDAGSVYNMATADSTESEQDTDDETVTLPQNPAIDIVKTTNDMDGGTFLVGSTITWKYVVKNTGNVTLTNVAVTDDILGAVCNITSLDPGASQTCTKTGTAIAGQYNNTGDVSAKDPKGNDVTDSDDSSYFGADPEIDVEKYVSIDGGTTWVDADTATGPYLNSGTAPQFKFVVTNTGNVALSSVTITDSDFTLPAGCIASTLAVGASDDCIVTGTWASGQHNDKATASGSFTDDAAKTETDTDTDDANYFGADPKIDLTKTGAWVDGNANGFADVGEKINYTFTVKNIGNVALSNVTVTDPKVSPISCPKTTLAVNESMNCTGSYTLTLADIYAGNVNNTATAYGSFTDDNNNNKTVNDPASATVTLPLEPTGQIRPTRTSCEQFRDGTGETMQQYYPPYGYVYYMLKGKLINSINPGVFFYYTEVTLAGGQFTINVTQSNDKGWPKIPTQVGDNIVLWDATCTKVQDLAAAYDPTTGNATISGSVPAGTYYVSVKWEPSAYYDKVKNGGLLGYAPTGKPMVKYTFEAYLTDANYTGPIASSGASQIIAPKK